MGKMHGIHPSTWKKVGEPELKEDSEKEKRPSEKTTFGQTTEAKYSSEGK
jgi:hypothetical protein